MHCIACLCYSMASCAWIYVRMYVCTHHCLLVVKFQSCDRCHRSRPGFNSQMVRQTEVTNQNSDFPPCFCICWLCTFCILFYPPKQQVKKSFGQHFGKVKKALCDYLISSSLSSKGVYESLMAKLLISQILLWKCFSEVLFVKFVDVQLGAKSRAKMG